MCEKCEQVKSILKTWLHKQGHDRCWYYPELFKQLIDLYGIKHAVPPCLPTRDEFERGCRQYQEEEYNESVRQSKGN